MLKALGLAIAFSTVIITGLPKRAFGDSPNFAYPVVSAIDDGNLFCFMQTSDGRTLNLSRICGTTTTSQSSGSSSIVTPTPDTLSSSGPVGNIGSLRNTSTSDTPCFLFDAQGRPCS
jgi:hypothetical protein